MQRHQRIVFRNGLYRLRANNGFSKMPNCQQILSCAVFMFQVYTMYFEILQGSAEHDQITETFKVFSFLVIVILKVSIMRMIAQKTIGGVFFAFGAVLTFCSAFLCSFIDPTDEGTKDTIESILNQYFLERNQAFQHNRNKQIDRKPEAVPDKANEYFCSFCTSHVSARVKHCKKCNRCVNGFDHHCKWINNCIGEKNYRCFIFMIVSTWIKSVSYICTCCLVIYEDFQDLPTSRFIKIIVGLTFSTIIFLCISNLVMLHIYLYKRGMTTYEFILETRRKQSVNPEEELARQRMIEQIKQSIEMKKKRMQRPANKSTSIANHFKGKENEILPQKQKITEAPQQQEGAAPIEFQVNFYKQDKSDDFNLNQINKNKEETKVSEQVPDTLRNSYSQHDIGNKVHQSVSSDKKSSNIKDSQKSKQSSQQERLSKISIVSQFIVGKTFDENEVGFSDENQIQCSPCKNKDIQLNQALENQNNIVEFHEVNSLSTESAQIPTIECNDDDQLFKKKSPKKESLSKHGQLAHIDEENNSIDFSKSTDQHTSEKETSHCGETYFSENNRQEGFQVLVDEVENEKIAN